MQTVNPTQVVKPKTASALYRIPVQVICVVHNLDDAKREDLQAIRKFCQEEKVSFETRAYDSSRYRHDRDEVASLPAFHIHLRGRYEKTFYPVGRPYQIIDEYITMYLEQQRIAWEKKHKWSAFWKGVRARLRRLLHKETRLERAERERHEHAAAAQSRMSFDGRARSMSMIDWE
jgi:hypothetical protein